MKFILVLVVTLAVYCADARRLRLVRSPYAVSNIDEPVPVVQEHVVVARAAQYGYNQPFGGGAHSGSHSQASSSSGSFGGGLGGFGGSGSQSSAQSSAGSNAGGFGGYGR